jgi:hypothetical protein
MSACQRVSFSAFSVMTLTIEFTPGQPLRVVGPLADKVLCYGMIEAAKDIIREFKTPTIGPASAIPANGVQQLQQRP